MTKDNEFHNNAILLLRRLGLHHCFISTSSLQEFTMSASAALNDSLTTINTMLHDLFDEHENDGELTDNLKVLLETAQRNISRARQLRSRQALKDETQAEQDLLALSKRLTVKQKWLIHHLSKRSNVDQELAGSESQCMIEAGLIQKVDGKIELTDAGRAVNAIWTKK
jgi:predicted transcriptional regulator